MTSANALEQLRSPKSRVRLEGARALQARAVEADIDEIRNRLQNEPDAWVRRALLKALRRLQPGELEENPTPSGIAEVEAAGLIDDVWAEATEEVTALLAHEISPLVVAIAGAASRELGADYGQSATAAAVEHLRGLLDVVTRLRRAAQAPEPREFDLTDLMMAVIREELIESKVSVEAARNDPVLVGGDPDLVRLVCCNALRNAVEAVAVMDDLTRRVIVNWGVTDRDAWVSILDEGCGLPQDHSKAFHFGTSSKSKSIHFGVGLAIAKQAAVSSGGRLSLKPRQTGAAFLFEWPQPSWEAD